MILKDRCNEALAMPIVPHRRAMENGPRDYPVRNYQTEMVKYPNKRDNKDIICFRCSEKGHIAVNCSSKFITPRRKVMCFRCGDCGHISSRCLKQIDSENEEGKLRVPVASQ